MFQSSVIAFLAGNSSNKTEQEMLSKIFKQLDTSKDGYLQIEEIEEGFAKVAVRFKNQCG